MPVALDLEATWHAFRGQLRAFVARRVPRDADADDIVQLVFLRLHQSLPTLRESERVHAWLHRTARRAIADHYRERARRREVASGGAADLDALPREAVPADGVDERRAFAACLDPMVSRLAPAYRQAIVLADLEGVRVADAARAAGVSLTAMKARVRRGRQQLRRLLGECCRAAVEAAACEARGPEAFGGRCG